MTKWNDLERVCTMCTHKTCSACGDFFGKAEYEDDNISTHLSKINGKYYCEKYIENSIRVWTMKTHNNFTETFKQIIICLMKCNNNKKSAIYKIPKELMYIIFSYIKDCSCF